MGKRARKKAREHIPSSLWRVNIRDGESSDSSLPMNEAEVMKGDEVAVAGREVIGIARTEPDEFGNVWVDCKTDSATGFYHRSLLFHTDKVTKRVRSKSSKEKKLNTAGFETESLDSVEEGDKIILSTGDKITVDVVSSRQVRAGDFKFVKSSGEGWGDQEVTAKPNNSGGMRNVCKELDNIEEGSIVKISNGEYEQVTKVSARQIRTNNYKFKRSDGTGWSDQKEIIDLN